VIVAQSPARVMPSLLALMQIAGALAVDKIMLRVRG
jgi:hypothetical protein